MNYLLLFFSFFKIGLFAFGGGYATIPLIEREIVISHGWLTRQQFLQVVAIAGMTPGPVGINSATFVGYRVAGIPGSIVATGAVVLPSLIIVSFLFYLFKKYLSKAERKTQFFFANLRPVVLSLILAASVSIAQEGVMDIPTGLIAVVAFLLTVFTRINILYTIAGSGCAGILLAKFF